MSRSNMSFVEWKEEFVSQERGSRIVHYILKDSFGESILAVVGTERSLRHMVYAVADEFLNVYGSENGCRGGFKWRSRREVVDWLTSMLCKQKLQDSPRGSAHAMESSKLNAVELKNQQIHESHKMNHRANCIRNPYSDIRWLGASWICNRQLHHYPSFSRNETTISIQSFVFVMANEENQYVAYIEDMYEDKKGQKKVKVRWFHHVQEVKSTVRVRNSHSKEVFYTPYTQVISAECVDGPAVVLTREHFEKYVDRLPPNMLTRVHLCSRQFRNNKIKSFDLSKLKGYFGQQILSSLETGNFFKLESLCYALQSDSIKDSEAGENLMRGTKRSRNYGEQQSFLTAHSDAQFSGKPVKMMFDSLCQNIRNLEFRRWHGWIFKVGAKIEFLCQDSGIRGCWFRCTVLEISQKHMKVQYDDVDDEDGCGKLEEWIRAFRLAAPDRLAIRSPVRPVVRPQPVHIDFPNSMVEVGAQVDAWWNDGWWEGVITIVSDSSEKIQVHIPGENMSIDVLRKDLRISRDWVEGKWVDLNLKHDILSVISGTTSPRSKSPGAPIPSMDANEYKNCVNDDMTQDPNVGNIDNAKNENDDSDSKSRVLDSSEEADSVLGGKDEDDNGNANEKDENTPSNSDLQCYGTAVQENGSAAEPVQMTT